MTMPATPEQLFARLDALGIAHETIAHPPVYTAEDGVEWKQKVPGLHCKNLFMHNRDGQIWLIVMPAFERASLNHIFKQLGAGRMSFCPGEMMLPILGVPPGSATPMALMNDSAKEMKVAVDRTVAEAPVISVHPLHNAASTVISGADLLLFLEQHDFTPVLCNTFIR